MWTFVLWKAKIVMVAFWERVGISKIDLGDGGRRMETDI